MAIDIYFDLNELQTSVALQHWLHCWCLEPGRAGGRTLTLCGQVLLDGAGLQEVGSVHHGMDGARKPLTGEALGAHSSGSLQARQVPKGWGMQPLMLGLGAGPISRVQGREPGMDMELMAECWDQSACTRQSEGGHHPDLGHLRLGLVRGTPVNRGWRAHASGVVGKETVRPQPQVITASRYPCWGGHTSKK